MLKVIVKCSSLATSLISRSPPCRGRVAGVNPVVRAGRSLAFLLTLQEEKQRKGLAAKLELAKFLQETIAEMARRNKAQTDNETQKFSTYVQQVKNYPAGSVHQTLYCY